MDANNADRVRGVGGRARGWGRVRVRGGGVQRGARGGLEVEEEEEEDKSDREEEEDKDQEQEEWSLINWSVINHGLTMREAGPNLSRFTVAGKIQTFRNDNRYVTIYCNLDVLMYT